MVPAKTLSSVCELFAEVQISSSIHRTPPNGEPNLEVQQWLTLRLVLGLDELARFILTGYAQTGSLAGGSFHAVEGSAAIAPPNQTVPVIHWLFHATATINTTESASLACSNRFNARYAKF